MIRQYPIADLGACEATFNGQGLLVEKQQPEPPKETFDQKVRSAIYALYECLDRDSVEEVISHFKEYDLPDLSFEAEQGLKDTACSLCDGSGWIMTSHGNGPVVVECRECGNSAGLPKPG